jgi:hypothetical protein
VNIILTSICKQMSPIGTRQENRWFAEVHYLQDT